MIDVIMAMINSTRSYSLQDLESLVEIVAGLNLAYYVLERFRYKRRIVDYAKKCRDSITEDIPESLKEHGDYKVLTAFGSETSSAFHETNDKIESYEWAKKYKFWFASNLDRKITRFCIIILLTVPFLSPWWEVPNLPFSLFIVLQTFVIALGVMPIFLMHTGDSIVINASKTLRHRTKDLKRNIYIFTKEKQGDIKDTIPPTDDTNLP